MNEISTREQMKEEIKDIRALLDHIERCLPLQQDHQLGQIYNALTIAGEALGSLPQ